MHKAVEHQPDHGAGDHGLGNLGQFLVILGQPAPSAEPTEGSFNHPPARDDDETGGPRDPANDDQRQTEQEAGEQDRQAVVDAVGENSPEPAVQRLDAFQQVTCPVSILDVGGVDEDSEPQAGGVNRDMALAAVDLLGRIVATRAPFSVVLTL